ncbi:hypothetical protein BO70DRAFT_301475 [Aspergillus heteromorphus CBS 117.55]|uniref:SMP-30/Gluconolactonase/LRE-like region domain-containing protein n=1 Tax=Aspergillus heteromorphus CBS 117.55 TaxID=1448321 RepID=A0A317V132_9EURO|nr:uncharacterized protein BO70DRAFT_301475 [Aspergillus heteromorphus CBS 117.55]PWY66788.1 hypothetical protein BO70DRAFT_301475 [Aspergillus heteromorphus CBS 117.55]
MARAAALSNGTASTRTLFQLQANRTWFENLAVRADGTLLATRMDVPEVWSLDPATGVGRLLYTFPNATALTGITEIAPDTYAVTAGDIIITTSGQPTPGTFAVWALDLQGSATPAARLIAAVPGAGFANGLTHFGPNADLVLIADAMYGLIWRLNVVSGASSVALQDATMVRSAESPYLAVNGVRSWGEYVYYTADGTKAVYRIPVDRNATATGPVELVAGGFSGDDFAIAADGTVYVATNTANEVLAISAAGDVSVLAGASASPAVAGCTSVQLSPDGRRLFVTTNGGLIKPVAGGEVPAKVVEVVL